MTKTRMAKTTTRDPTKLGFRLGCASVFTLAFALSAQARIDELERTPKEDDRPAPIDYGFGPNVRPTQARSATAAFAAAVPSAVNARRSAAHTQGVFGAPVPWPIIAIHAVLLPDGRVLSYGTTTAGAQGGFVIDVWTPKQGFDVNIAHMQLPTLAGNDIFCSAQSMIWSTGEVLIAGGDVKKDIRNYSSNAVQTFKVKTNSLKTESEMTYERWYPTLVPLPNGNMVALGGRKNQKPDVPVKEPELFNLATRSWTVLNGAANDTAFGTVGWYYPRGYQAPNGEIFVLGRTGYLFYMTTAGNGSIRQLTPKAPAGEANLPTVMFEPGKILSVRINQQVVVVNINNDPPVVTRTDDTDQLRHWSNMTVLADGKVMLSGGSKIR